MLRKTLAAVVLAAMLPTFALPVHTARGDVDIAEMPKTIAVFDPGVIDTLTALGVKIDAMPDMKQDTLKDAKTVGTVFEPDLEALAALKPDLIMVAVRTAKKFDDVSRVAPTIDLTLDNKNAYEQGLARLANLGELFGKQAEAKAWTDKLNALRDETKALAANQGKVLAILTNGPKLSIYGKDSRIAWIEPTLGLELLDKAKPEGANHGNPISFEYIAEVNPDWIFVIDRGAAIRDDKLEPAQKVLDTELVKNTNAGKNDRIVYLNPRNIYINVGGVQALEQTMTEIRDALKAKGAK